MQSSDPAKEITFEELQERAAVVTRKLSKEDKPHQRLTIENMTSEQYHEHIFACQTHRITAANAYLVAEESKRLATVKKIKEKLDQQHRLMNEELVRLDKLIEKMNRRASTIFSMRDELNQLELGEDL